MHPNTRVLVLIAAACAALKVSERFFLLTLFGYIACDIFDKWLQKRRREKVISNEMDDWEVDIKEKEYENKGKLSRIRLTGQNQIIAARVAELLRQIP